MTSQRQSAINLHSQVGATLGLIEELTKKVEHLLQRRLRREERTFLALATESSKSNAKPLSKSGAGTAKQTHCAQPRRAAE
jgi:hypothetical protein